jgi:hypothetical protein
VRACRTCVCWPMSTHTYPPEACGCDLFMAQITKSQSRNKKAQMLFERKGYGRRDIRQLTYQTDDTLHCHLYHSLWVLGEEACGLANDVFIECACNETIKCKENT